MADDQVVLNICGEGEIAGAINLNNLAATMRSVEAIEEAGQLIRSDVLRRWPIDDESIDLIVGNNIPGFDRSEREFIARESMRVLGIGGQLNLHSMSGKIVEWAATMKSVGLVLLRREPRWNGLRGSKEAWSAVMTKKQVLAFLKKEVPGEASKFAAWRKQAAAAGRDAAPICLVILKSASAARHYSALLMFRELGYKAEQRGDGSRTAYHIQSPECSRVVLIHPSHTMSDLGSAAEWLRGAGNFSGGLDRHTPRKVSAGTRRARNGNALQSKSGKTRGAHASVFR